MTSQVKQLLNCAMNSINTNLNNSAYMKILHKLRREYFAWIMHNCLKSLFLFSTYILPDDKFTRYLWSVLVITLDKP